MSLNVILPNNSQLSREGALPVFLDSFLCWQEFLSRKGQVSCSILDVENLCATWSINQRQQSKTHLFRLNCEESWKFLLRESLEDSQQHPCLKIVKDYVSLRYTLQNATFCFLMNHLMLCYTNIYSAVFPCSSLFVFTSMLSLITSFTKKIIYSLILNTCTKPSVDTVTFSNLCGSFLYLTLLKMKSAKVKAVFKMILLINHSSFW